MTLNEQFEDFRPSDWLAIIGCIMAHGGLTDIVLTEDFMRSHISTPATKNLMAQRHPQGLQFHFITEAEADFFRNTHPATQKETH